MKVNNYVLLLIVVLTVTVLNFMNSEDQTFCPNYYNKTAIRRRQRHRLESFNPTYTQYNNQVIGNNWNTANFDNWSNSNPPPVSRDITKKPLSSSCTNKVKSVDQFHKDFFNFRDMIDVNSSIREDPVDRIVNMRLYGGLTDARFSQSSPKPTKISDIYDNLTQTPQAYTNRLAPLVDRSLINTPGYKSYYGTQPLQLIGETWAYPNEKIMNGAQIKPGLYGADPYANNNVSVQQMDQNIVQNYYQKYQ